jgi:hypothetical protein
LQVKGQSTCRAPDGDQWPTLFSRYWEGGGVYPQGGTRST